MYIVINRLPEEWVPLDAYNIKPIYEISNYGNIRHINTVKKIKTFISSDGYIRVALRRRDDSRRVFLVHRLVAFMFVDGYNPELGKVIVNHLDSDRSHAYFENLEWVTYRENIIHGYEHGHIIAYKQRKIIIPKFSDDLLHLICGYLECGYAPSKIYELISPTIFSKKCITDLIHRLKSTDLEIYRRITQYYNIPKPQRQINLTEDIVRKICYMLSKSFYTEDIIRALQIPPEQVNKYRKNICDIKYRRTFCDISFEYDFPDDIYIRRSVFSTDAIIEICEQLQDHIPLQQITDYISAKYKYDHTRTRDFIYDVKRRRIHMNISTNYKW